MKRAIVTGAAGFVAANLVRRLLRDGYEVVATIRPQSDTWRIDGLRDDIDCVELDITDAERVAEVIGRVRPDTIFHLAAHGAYSWQCERRRIFDTNLGGAINVLEAAVTYGVSTAIVAGSSSEYGFKDHSPAETEALEPNSDYAAAKAAATLLAGYFGRSESLDVVTLRLYSAYGPWEDPGRLVPTLVSSALAGRLPPLVDPDVARDFVFVEDAVDAFIRAAEQAKAVTGRIYNLGTGRQTTLREIVEAARRLFGVKEEPVWNTMPQRTWDTKVWVADSARIQTELGWESRTSLEDGLAATAEWLTKAGTAVREKYIYQH
ncbi:MAG: NAD-dependent epimerase/dehydratase family protein [Gaiellaceae bacterium]